LDAATGIVSICVALPTRNRLWGIVQRETAQRDKSEGKDNLHRVRKKVYSILGKTSSNTDRVLPREAMRCAVLLIVILSVYPSVRLSFTPVDCVHTVRPTIMIASQYGSPMILVSGDIKFIPKFEGGHPEQGR